MFASTYSIRHHATVFVFSIGSVRLYPAGMDCIQGDEERLWKAEEQKCLAIAENTRRAKVGVGDA